jgi:hypothetical protein
MMMAPAKLCMLNVLQEPTQVMILFGKDPYANGLHSHSAEIWVQQFEEKEALEI